MLEIWLEDEAKDMAEQEEQLTGIETLTYHNFDSSESAQKFGEEALTKGLCSRFDVEGCNITFYDASEKAIDRLLESEPEQPKDNKNWLNQSAFIYKGSATVNIGFKLKKTRDMWAKYFELVHPNCKLEKQEFSYISNCKRELAVTCYDIGETAYGDEFLEKIKRWDFWLSPDEIRNCEREPEPTPEPVQMSIKLANNATFHPSYQQLVMDFDTVELCESLGNHAVKDWLCNEFSVLTKEGFYRLQLKEVQTLENAEAIIALAKSAPAEIQPEIESGVDTNPPEPEPAGDDNDAEFLTENMAQNSSQPFQIPPKTKEGEPNDVSFHFQSQGKGVWLVFAIANGEKTQLAGVMQVGSYYRVPNLNNTDFGTLESAAKALWEHHQQRQKVFINF